MISMDNLYRSRLRDFRRNRKEQTTQQAFAEELGVTFEHYSAIENGKRNPSVPLHIAICRKLQKPSDCFFREDCPDMVLTEEQIAYLESLDTGRLKTLLNLFRAIYEET